MFESTRAGQSGEKKRRLSRKIEINQRKLGVHGPVIPIAVCDGDFHAARP